MLYAAKQIYTGTEIFKRLLKLCKSGGENSLENGPSGNRGTKNQISPISKKQFERFHSGGFLTLTLAVQVRPVPPARALAFCKSSHILNCPGVAM